jgi:hypothetical protein
MFCSNRTKSLSRLGAKRVWELHSPSRASLTVWDTCHYNVVGSPERLCAFDPDGGPFILPGRIVQIGRRRYTIVELLTISSVKDDEHVLWCKVSKL